VSRQVERNACYDGSFVALWVRTTTVTNLWLPSCPSETNFSPRNHIVADERCRGLRAVVPGSDDAIAYELVFREAICRSALSIR
jgi:hypothetical protein